MNPSDAAWISALLDAQAAELDASPNTLLAYGRDLKSFAEFLNRRGKSLDRAAQEDIEAYLVDCEAAGLANSTRAPVVGDQAALPLRP